MVYITFMGQWRRDRLPCDRIPDSCGAIMGGCYYLPTVRTETHISYIITVCQGTGKRLPRGRIPNPRGIIIGCCRYPTSVATETRMINGIVMSHGEREWLPGDCIPNHCRLIGRGHYHPPTVGLKHWSKRSTFGPAGDTAGQWECPDLIELPVEGSAEKKWVLIINRNPGAPAGGTGVRYIIGKFDGITFTSEIPDAPALWADWGKDFYATNTWKDMPSSDGRNVWIGWFSNWQYANAEPTVLWRGAQSIPRTLMLHRYDGWTATGAAAGAGTRELAAREGSAW